MSKNKWIKNPDARSSSSETNINKPDLAHSQLYLSRPDTLINQAKAVGYDKEWLVRAQQHGKEKPFSYPFSICPLHFTGRGFSISKDESKNLYSSEIKVISYTEFKDSVIPPINIYKATALEWEDITGRNASLQYEIINKSFCEFLYFIETKRWQSGFHDKYTEQLFLDLRNGNIKIGLSLRVYSIGPINLINEEPFDIFRAKVFCKLWK